MICVHWLCDLLRWYIDVFRGAVCNLPQAVSPEFPVGPQPLQVLHISEQEEDILAFGMGLKQPVTKTTSAEAAIHEPLRATYEAACHSHSHTKTNLLLSFLSVIM